MARPLDHLLQIALAVTEGGFRLAPAFTDPRLQRVRPLDRAHPPPAAAVAGFQHQRIADLFGLGPDPFHVLAQHLGRGDHRNPGLDRHAPGAGLVAERAHRLGARPDEGDPGAVAGIDQFGVLAEQPVARMDRVGAGLLRHPDDLGDREIGRDRPQPGADPVGLVGLEPVQAQLVLLGEDGDRALAQLVRRAHHANGDLAAIGDQDLAESGHAVPRWSGGIIGSAARHGAVTIGLLPRGFASPAGGQRPVAACSRPDRRAGCDRDAPRPPGPGRPGHGASRAPA
jgi:hypothetical protein